jgi:hypothetical protein
MNVSFDEASLGWLKQKGFNEWEIEDAQKCLSFALKNESSEKTLRLPENTTLKVAALAYAILANANEETIKESANGKNISITDEIKRAFNEEIEISELDEIHKKIGKIKIGKLYSDARRKTSIKKGSEILE